MKITGKGSLENRGRKKWCIKVRLGKDPETGKLTMSKAITINGKEEEAKQALKDYIEFLRPLTWEQYKEWLDTGIVPEQSDSNKESQLTFRTLAETFQDERKAFKKVAKTTLNQDAWLFKTLSEHFGDMPVNEITHHDIKAYYRKLHDAGKSQNHIHELHKTLNKFFNYAFKEECIDANPCAKVDAPKRPLVSQRKSIPADKLPLLIQALANEPLSGYTMLVYIALGTGMRRGELGGLRWCDIDFDKELLHVKHSLNKFGDLTPPKSKAGIRDIPLDSTTLNRLRLWKSQQREYLFTLGIVQNEETPVITDMLGSFHDLCNVERWFRSFCVRSGFGWYVDEEGNRLPDQRYNENGHPVDENGQCYTRSNPKPRIKKHYQGLRLHELRHFVDINVLWSAPSLQGQIAL